MYTAIIPSNLPQDSALFIGLDNWVIKTVAVLYLYLKSKQEYLVFLVVLEIDLSRSLSRNAYSLLIEKKRATYQSQGESIPKI